MYKIGEYIIYGMNGVCRVEEIGPMVMNGTESEKEYYTLMPLYTKGSKVFTPVDNQKVVMRPIMTKTEASELIDEMRDVEPIEVVDDKRRELAYKEALKTCDCHEWIRIIYTARKRKEERQAEGKKMSACDEKYLRQAQESLYGELACSLNIDKNQVENYIEEHIVDKDMASAS